MNNKKITTTLSDGTKKEFDVIFTFKNENTEKDYIVYTDNSIDQNNKLICPFYCRNLLLILTFFIQL